MAILFNLLLVEDDPNDIELIKKALESGKILHHLVVMENGFQAMNYLLHRPPYTNADCPDLILLDLTLPALDGWNVLNQIKTDQDLKSIPVIVLTNDQDKDDIAKAYDLHANGYIIKPVSFDKFSEIIQKTTKFWFSIVVLPNKK